MFSLFIFFEGTRSTYSGKRHEKIQKAHHSSTQKAHALRFEARGECISAELRSEARKKEAPVRTMQTVTVDTVDSAESTGVEQRWTQADPSVRGEQFRVLRC